MDIKFVEIPFDDLNTITSVIDHAIAEKTSRNDMNQMEVYKKVQQWLHGGKYNVIIK